MIKISMHISRLFLGVVFLIAGINGFFVIFGSEPFIATSLAAMALFEFKYLLIAEKSLEVICGILLIVNQFIPLAIAILSPIVANIFLLHLFLDHSLLPLAIMLVLTFGVLLFYYRNNFMSLLERKPYSPH
ncbi:DoxX family membrane protein [Neobacillus sp. SAB-20_R2A]|uniref:DoxX family membrane protein n=1 Tax=Neobacillus sp. SAB-20_R2A TaxID=3120519 RepID=UPI003C6DCD26